MNCGKRDIIVDMNGFGCFIIMTVIANVYLLWFIFNTYKQILLFIKYIFYFTSLISIQCVSVITDLTIYLCEVVQKSTSVLSFQFELIVWLWFVCCCFFSTSAYCVYLKHMLFNTPHFCHNVWTYFHLSALSG